MFSHSKAHINTLYTWTFGSWLYDYKLTYNLKSLIQIPAATDKISEGSIHTGLWAVPLPIGTHLAQLINIYKG